MISFIICLWYTGKQLLELDTVNVVRGWEEDTQTRVLLPSNPFIFASNFSMRLRRGLNGKSAQKDLICGGVHGIQKFGPI